MKPTDIARFCIPIAFVACTAADPSGQPIDAGGSDVAHHINTGDTSPDQLEDAMVDMDSSTEVDISNSAPDANESELQGDIESGSDPDASDVLTSSDVPNEFLIWGSELVFGPTAAVLTGGRIALVWKSQVGFRAFIYLQLFEGDEAISEARLVSDADDVGSPHLFSTADNQFVVTWVGWDGQHGQRFDSEGEPVGDSWLFDRDFGVPASNGIDVGSVNYYAGELVFYQQSLTGSLEAGPISVGSLHSWRYQDLCAREDGTFVAVWVSGDVGQTVSAAIISPSEESTVSQLQIFEAVEGRDARVAPQVTCHSDNTFTVTWGAELHIWTQTFSIDGSPIATPVQVTPTVNDPDSNLSPLGLAHLPTNMRLVLYLTNHFGHPYEPSVAVRLLDMENAPLRPGFLAHRRDGGDQTKAHAISAPGGIFIVYWDQTLGLMGQWFSNRWLVEQEHD